MLAPERELMSPESPIRLDFQRPPLIEQAISVVFEPIEGFRIVDFGLFWNEIAEEFPFVSSEAPLEAPVEHFDELRARDVSFQVLAGVPSPRAMFQNGKGELIQLQSDRFGFNWAKEGDAEYPRSEPVMAQFEKLFGRFARYVAKQRLGDIVFKQCELTNLNVLPVAEFGEDYSDLANALKVDPLDLGLSFLRSETYIRNRQHRIVAEDGMPLGRLHMAIAPVVSNQDHSKAFRFELTARSAPNIKSIEDARHFFAVARNALNGAFYAMVTDGMRKKWGDRHE